MAVSIVMDPPAAWQCFNVTDERASARTLLPSNRRYGATLPFKRALQKPQVLICERPWSGREILTAAGLRPRLTSAAGALPEAAAEGAVRRLVLIGAMLALAGCFTVSYQTKLPGSGEYKEDRGDFFLWGLVGDKTVDLTAMCPAGVARWRSQQTFVDSLIGLVTIGIYIPRHVQVECAGGTAWNITLDGDGRLVSAVDAAPHAG